MEELIARHVAAAFSVAVISLFLIVGLLVYLSRRKSFDVSKRLQRRSALDEWRLIDPQHLMRTQDFRLYRSIAIPDGLIDRYRYENEQRKALADERGHKIFLLPGRAVISAEYEDDSGLFSPSTLKITFRDKKGEIAKAEFADCSKRGLLAHSPLKIQIDGREFHSQAGEISEDGNLVGYEYVEFKDGLTTLVALSMQTPPMLPVIMLYLVQAEQRYCSQGPYFR
jgi:hypothetical protein